MEIKLNNKEFSFIPGKNWIELWSIFALKDNTIVNYEVDRCIILECGKLSSEGFEINPEQTRMYYPLLLQALEQKACEIIDFCQDSTEKIEKLKYAITNFQLTLKEAKELLNKKVPKIKIWELPQGFEQYSRIRIADDDDKYFYLEEFGVFPSSVIKENKHLLKVLDYDQPLSQQDITPFEYKVYIDGKIEAVAPRGFYLSTPSKYTLGLLSYENKFVLDLDYFESKSNSELIGTYVSFREAKSHYETFEFCRSLLS